MQKAKIAIAQALVIATALAAFAPSMAKAANVNSANDVVNITATVDNSVTLTIDTATVTFGVLSSTNDRYATASGADDATAGSSMSLSTNAASGVTVAVSGNTLTRSGGGTIDAITTAGGAASSTGSEQFGIAFGAVSGFTIASGYDQSVPKYKFAAETVLSSAGPASDSAIDIYYLANISGLTEAGSYSTDLTFTGTGSF